LQRTLAFGATAGTPAGSFGSTDEPTTFDITLWPGIIITVGNKNNPDFGSGGQSALNQTTGAERFIVGVGRENRNARSGG
jgi:hypothetical protein